MIRVFLGFLGLVAVMIGVFVALSHRADLEPRLLSERYASASSRFVRAAPGLDVHVRDQGPATALPVILLHGAGGSLQTWEPWVNRLGTRFRFITLDLPGHGLTGPDPSGDYSAAASIKVIGAVARALDLGPFVIGGNARGGSLAWRFAAAQPLDVSGLILVDAGGAVAPGAPSPATPVLFSLYRMPLIGSWLVSITPDWLIERSLREMVAIQQAVTPDAVRQYGELLRNPGNRVALRSVLRTEWAPVTPAELTRVYVPTLVLWGRLDHQEPVQAASVFARRLPNAKLVVYEGVGHLPQMEVPDESAADVRAFLDGIAARRSAPPKKADQLDLAGPEKLPDWP